MAEIFEPNPEVPPELEYAAQSGMLVVFIGAGISRLVGCPSWSGFADAVLDQLVPKPIDYHELSLINTIADPRQRLSIARILEEKSGKRIDYHSIFNIPEPKSNVYEFINKFECSFVTTNYDKFIAPNISISKPETSWRFSNPKDFVAAKLDQRGSVIHLHGSIDDVRNMVVTTKDYLNHYSSREVPPFLEHLFKTKTVLFLGYGLGETEILEYIFKFADQTKDKERRLFVLQDFFNAERPLYEKLKEYYQQSFNTELIGFPKDAESFEQQKTIIENWGNKLSFQDPALFDQRQAMEDEIFDD